MIKYTLFLSAIICCTHSITHAQTINFNSEYDKLEFPWALNVKGGITGDDNNAKKLTLYHGNQIVFQTGTNAPDYNFNRLTINQWGNVGVGEIAPRVKLHVSGTGANIHGGNASELSGNFSIQANTGSRSTTNGAQLEFVLPASANGANPWGQARIITVAGNTGDGNATGKMILGTRRYFNKLNTGNEWYYGDDVVIDGSGNIGMGTLTPKEKLSVNGNIRSKEVKVETANWPDYVFERDYNLKSLSSIKEYISEHGHLPEIPSAAEIEKSGISLGEMNKLLTKKIEELTLHLIEKDEQLKVQRAELDKQAQKVECLEIAVKKLLEK